MSAPLRTRRLLRELRQLKQSPSPHYILDATDSIDRWTLRLRGAADTLYADEEYTLVFEFPADYPHEAPTVTFAG
ncbi:putative ubiquitin-conjugating enzyme E2 17, partial [Coemansia nantahalensis]